MAKPGTVVVRDLGFDRIRNDFVKSGNPVLKVGIQGNDATDTHGDFGGGSRPLTNVELGVIHEFGAPGARIPERSFIRSTVDTNKAKYQATMATITKAVIAGLTSVSSGLHLLGIQVESDIKGTIDRGIKPPLKASTLAARRRKGTYNKVKNFKPTPLVDTGQLRNSITSVVTKKGAF